MVMEAPHAYACLALRALDANLSHHVLLIRVKTVAFVFLLALVIDAIAQMEFRASIVKQVNIHLFFCLSRENF